MHPVVYALVHLRLGLGILSEGDDIEVASGGWTDKRLEVRAVVRPINGGSLCSWLQLLPYYLQRYAHQLFSGAAGRPAGWLAQRTRWPWPHHAYARQTGRQTGRQDAFVLRSSKSSPSAEPANRPNKHSEPAGGRANQTSTLPDNGRSDEGCGTVPRFQPSSAPSGYQRLCCAAYMGCPAVRAETLPAAVQGRCQLAWLRRQRLAELGWLSRLGLLEAVGRASMAQSGGSAPAPALPGPMSSTHTRYACQKVDAEATLQPAAQTATARSHSSLPQPIQPPAAIAMRGGQSALPIHTFDDTSHAISALCNSRPEDSMTSEQQAKRRRTDSRATDTESLAAETPSGQPSPPTARRTPSVGHALPAIRSPTNPAQLQLHQQLQPYSAYYQDPNDSIISQQYQYPSQQQHQHYYQQHQQQQQHSQQFGIVATHASSPSISSAATTLNPPRSAMPQQFITPHAIPATLLSQNSAVAGSEYSMWFYAQQHMQPSDRAAAAAAAASAGSSANAAAAAAVAAASVGGMASSTSVSPVSQHTLAPADHQYPIQPQFDSQMRYMAVPGQHHSGMPKPMSAAGVALDATLRSNTATSAQQQYAHAHQNAGIPALQHYHHPYQQAQTHNTQYPSYYHHSQQQTPQQAFSTHHSVNPHLVQSQLPSPFPTQASPLTSTNAAAAAVAAAVAMSDTSSGHASVGPASESNSILHPGAFMGTSSESDRVSAAQVAAAVAAVTASTHTHPLASSGVSAVSGPVLSADSSNGSAGSSSAAIGITSTSRLGMGLGDIGHPTGVPAFKFSMSMQSSGDTSIPEYFEASTLMQTATPHYL
ncbi:hypothetical protein GGI07_005491 [Coemansia sp. Benny D115]|nr:hypothetical protein GGI07_005491 [Coemansia sp. Benny D115]